jgi:hypothetical protein
LYYWFFQEGAAADTMTTAAFVEEFHNSFDSFNGGLHVDPENT